MENVSPAKTELHEALGAQEPVSLSVVIPAYNEEQNVERVYSELVEALAPVEMSWEVVFVDDGSTDDTWAVIKALQQRDPRVLGIRLSRNFGHQNALFAGLHNTSGSAVISMDCDLQHPPNVIPAMVTAWQEGNKIVHTARIDAGGTGWIKRMTSRAFYALFSWLSGVKLKNGMADFRLLDRQVLQDILRFGEQGLFLRGIVQWVGYRSVCIEFRTRARLFGKTKYTFTRMMKFAWWGISSFSVVPLRIGVLVGMTASALSFLGVAYAIYGKVVAGDAISGWTSTVAIMSFLFGVLFFYLGLLGEYLGRVIVEVRARPRYLISERADPKQ